MAPGRTASNYEEATHILQLLQDMSKSAFDEVFHGKGSAASSKKNIENKMRGLADKQKKVSSMWCPSNAHDCSLLPLGHILFSVE